MFFKDSRTPSLDDLGANNVHEAWTLYCASHDDACDLSGSNPTAVGLPSIDLPDEIMAAAVRAPYRASAQGLSLTREAIANYYKDANANVKPENIQLYASTSEAIGAILKLLCLPGDEVITCTPTYPLLDCLTALECVRLIEIPLQDCAREWTIDFYTLEKTCTPKTRALIVVSPNNPTGHKIRCDEMTHLVEFCAKRDVALIVDEVFASYAFHENNEQMPEAAAAYFNEPHHGLIITLSGLSKVCGLPQHKLGWALFGGAPNVVAEAMQRMSFITDSTLSVSGWVQQIAPEYLKRRNEFRTPCMERLRQNLHLLHHFETPDDTQWYVDHVDGGWSACLRLPARLRDEPLAARLAASGVRLFPGAFFGYRETQPTLVVSLITPTPVLNAGMTRLCACLKEWI